MKTCSFKVRPAGPVVGSRARQGGDTRKHTPLSAAVLNEYQLASYGISGFLIG
jgi:hypothetical protein